MTTKIKASNIDTAATDFTFGTMSVDGNLTVTGNLTDVSVSVLRRVYVRFFFINMIFLL